MLKKLWTLVKKLRIHWLAVYAAYAALIYLRIFGFFGLVGFTVLLVVFNKQIHKLDIVVSPASQTAAAPKA